MISRRSLMAALAAAAVPVRAGASSPRLSLSGSMEQGSLVIGRVESGARITVDAKPVSVSPNGFFAFGFEYNRTSPAVVVAQFASGGNETRKVPPVVRNYEIQRINGLPENYVAPPPEIETRILNENALVATARKRDTPGSDFAEPFDWPVPGIISSPFGSQRILNGVPKSPHFGVDIAAPEGTPIRAPAGGIVSLAQPDFYLSGGTILLDHGHGVSTVYIHQSVLKATVEQAVKRGDVIGLVGMKGRATGPHLHWGLNWFQVRLDPSLSARTPAPPKA